MARDTRTGTVEQATISMTLNGIKMLGQVLRVSRPANYNPAESAIAHYTQGQPGSLPGIAPGVAATVAAAPPPPAPAVDPTTARHLALLATCHTLACSNMLTPEELADPTERLEVQEDVTEECKTFGQVPSSHF